MHLSIIMPVFNAERTLPKTLKSIFGQLSPEMEVIVVDDGSTDSTSEILAHFEVEAKGYLRLIRQKNAGAAAARNIAIEKAKGDYLVFIDADDCFLEGALETIFKETRGGVDILGWDWQNVNEIKVRRFRQADYFDAKGALRNLMGGTMKWNLWLFAVKRKLVVDNNIHFLSGADMGEDMSFILRSFACATNVRQTHEILYEYNASSITSISRQITFKRQEEVFRNLLVTERALIESPYKNLCEDYLPHLKLYIKRPLLIGFSKEKYRLWYNWFPEANAHAKENTELPRRIRFLQWLASKRMWNGVFVYNVLYHIALRLC